MLSLTDQERRCIMLLLPVRDLLQLSASCRSLRSDLHRLMHGDLDVRLSLSLPVADGEAPTEAAHHGVTAERSFCRFLEAGGAPLVKTLVLNVLENLPGDSIPLLWPPMTALEILDVVSYTTKRRRDVCKIVAVAAQGVIAAAPRLREVQLCFPSALVPLDAVFQQIRCLKGAPSCNWTDLLIEAETCYLHVQEDVGLPTCPPLQRLLVLADCIGLKLIASEENNSTASGNAAARHPREQGPVWESIQLRPRMNVSAYDPESIRVLLEAHPPEQLTILGASGRPDLPTMFFGMAEPGCSKYFKVEDELTDAFLRRMTR